MQPTPTLDLNCHFTAAKDEVDLQACLCYPEIDRIIQFLIRTARLELRKNKVFKCLAEHQDLSSLFNRERNKPVNGRTDILIFLLLCALGIDVNTHSILVATIEVIPLVTKLIAVDPALANI